ncbi:hypothetical protein CANCADRAFT_56578 [Tortispora caseinolytica NRRL Y-17796]|uniref:Uncharacterized protein n=1 Tax=Tortispora caseinolytica NRRL Y-17796 TaxID=767744 RepID=A0A1E4TE10_9ASCO|nr:hypothetical protein CANCADRAFT_56578 [Tortispora caseinolytica NRRL Y-17796]
MQLTTLTTLILSIHAVLAGLPDSFDRANLDLLQANPVRVRVVNVLCNGGPASASASSSPVVDGEAVARAKATANANVKAAAKVTAKVTAKATASSSSSITSTSSSTTSPTP